MLYSTNIFNFIIVTEYEYRKQRIATLVFQFVFLENYIFWFIQQNTYSTKEVQNNFNMVIHR